jgi:hypothetical protein
LSVERGDCQLSGAIASSAKAQRGRRWRCGVSGARVFGMRVLHGWPGHTSHRLRRAASQAPGRALPAPVAPHYVFLDKNRRHIDKSQSRRPAYKDGRSGHRTHYGGEPGLPAQAERRRGREQQPRGTMPQPREGCPAAVTAAAAIAARGHRPGIAQKSLRCACRLSPRVLCQSPRSTDNRPAQLTIAPLN